MEESRQEGQTPEAPSLELFLGEPTRDLGHWRWLWEQDQSFPIRSHRGLLGRLVVLAKRLLRPFFKVPLADLWDRQRVFNLILLDRLEELGRLRAEMRAEMRATLDTHSRWHEERLANAISDVQRHDDALYARVDQKLDRYRREAKTLWSRLGALIAAGQADPPRSLADVQREQGYVAFEEGQRGSEEEISSRLAVYLPFLDTQNEVLDLGCGRGEALEVFGRHGLDARGIDASSEMVAVCREKGLEVAEGDLLQHLAGLEEGRLGGVVSFHVIEHLPPQAVDRLVRLAWRALAPGGVLILETPSPLSLVTAARNFWIDPTHQRPVHPASLEQAFREAGFEPVHRVDLQPFPEDERLPEIRLEELPEAQQAVADHVNRLRDILDDLLFGYRDYGMVGVKPAG